MLAIQRDQSHFSLVNLVEKGDEAFIRYECEFKDGGTFRNTEYFRVEGNKIKEVCVYFGGDTAPANSKGTGEAQIRALIEGWVKAVRAKDINERMSNYAPDAVSFDAVNPLRRIGSEAIRERLREWFALYEGPIGYEIRDLSITAGDDVAFSLSLNRISGTLKDGKKVDMWVRETCCFRNVHGKWLAAHTHVSVPFDGNSGKASVDQKP